MSVLEITVLAALWTLHYDLFVNFICFKLHNNFKQNNRHFILVFTNYAYHYINDKSRTDSQRSFCV